MKSSSLLYRQDNIKIDADVPLKGAPNDARVKENYDEKIIHVDFYETGENHH